MKNLLALHRPRTEGNVLLVVLCLALVLGISMGAVFSYTSNQVTAVARSQAWNESLIIADAGIEDGLQLLNRYADTGIQPLIWSATADKDGWAYIGANTFHVQRLLGSNYYNVYITNSGQKPWIRSTGTRAWKGRGGKDDVGRTILVQTTTSSLFQGALLAKRGITFNGTVRVDSFNSQNPLYSSNGMYNPLKAKDGGSVASIASNVVNIVTVGGSVDIYGKVYTGPESTIKLVGGGTIGSDSWYAGGNTGVEPGAWESDLNVDIPDAPLPPPGSYLPPPSQLLNVVLGTNYPNSYLLSGANYKCTSTDAMRKLTASDTIVVVGNVKLYFTGDFSMAGSSQIKIMPGASLTVFAGGSLDFSGGGVLNGTSFATNLTVYGLNSCTSIKLAGGQTFTGTIYAPNANYVQDGGGSSVQNLNGSIVANTITLSGSSQVHYDESLQQIPAGPIYYVMSWREL